MGIKAVPKMTWKQGQRCYGVYHGIEFTGCINEDTRPTVDYRNTQFCVTLDNPFTLYGNERTTVCIVTNHDENELYFY